MAIRRRNRGRMLAVHLQPPTHPKAFDLVVAMSHDRLEGPNVLRVDTALHGITPAVLAAAATHHDDRFKSLPRPWTGVLLGGATRHKPFSSEDAMRLAHQLDLLRAHIGGSLLLTPSRRTPADVLAAFAARYLRDQTVWIWAGDPPNPYVPLLARSDRLVVTSDSISMISEALATTAPISIFHVAGGARHERFVQNLIAKQLVFPLGAEPPMTARTPIDATPIVAELVRQRFSRLQ